EAALHVVELPHHITRRAARDARDWAESLEVPAMTERALTARRHRLSLLDAARWCVCNESRARIAQRFDRFGVLRDLDDSRADRFAASLRALHRDEHAA